MIKYACAENFKTEWSNMHISTKSPTIELAIEIEKRHVFTKFEKDPRKHRESQCDCWAERILFTVGSTASYTFVNVFNSDDIFSRFQIFWYLLHLAWWFIYALSNRRCSLPDNDTLCLLTCTCILQNLLIQIFLCASVYLYLRMEIWFDRRTLCFPIRNTRNQLYLISISVFVYWVFIWWHFKNFDTFTGTPVRVSKMNAVARAQLKFQMLTLLKK